MLHTQLKEKDALPPAPKTREELWSVIAYLRDFSLPDLKTKEGPSMQTLRRHVASLVKAGHLREEAERPTGICKRYHVVSNSAARPDIDLAGKSKPPSGRQRMWAGMKVSQVFDFRDVSLWSSVPLEAARLYCYALRNAGYLSVRRAASANGTPELYKFNRNKDTGIYAPQITREKKVFDRNLGQIVWPEEEAV